MYIDTIVLKFDSKEELEFFKQNLGCDVWDESKYYQKKNEEDEDLWIEFIVRGVSERNFFESLKQTKEEYDKKQLTMYNVKGE